MPVPDRKKQRREYLRKKVFGYASLLVGFSMLSVAIVVLTSWKSYAVTGIRLAGDVLGPLSMVVGIVVSIVASISYFRDGIKQVKTTSYIPPVTPNTLPAEEVLVRGSQEPEEEQSAVLLRAVKESGE